MAGLGFGQSLALRARDPAIAYMIELDPSLSEEACSSALHAAAGSVPVALDLLFSGEQGPQLRLTSAASSSQYVIDLCRDDDVQQCATPVGRRMVVQRGTRAQTPPPLLQPAALPPLANHPAPPKIPHWTKRVWKAVWRDVVILFAAFAVWVVMAHACQPLDAEKPQAPLRVAPTALSVNEHVHGIDYNQLTQEQAENLRSKVRAEYAAAVGVSVDDVEVGLAAGSVKINTKIKVRSRSDAERAQTVLDFSNWLSFRIHMHVYKVGARAHLANITSIIQRALRDVVDHAFRIGLHLIVMVNSSVRYMLATASRAIMACSSSTWAAINRYHEVLILLTAVFIFLCLFFVLAVVWCKVLGAQLRKGTQQQKEMEYIRAKKAEELKQQQKEMDDIKAKVVSARLAMPYSLDPPAYWKWRGYCTGDVSQAAPTRVRCLEMDGKMATLLGTSALHPHGCPGRDGSSEFLDHVQSVSVWRLEHPFLWEQYRHKLEALKKTLVTHNIDCKEISPKIPHHELLDASVNEVMLWHGTKGSTVDTIVAHGFDERVCNLHGLYGAGLYFASESCKSGQYAPASNGVHHFLYCRVALGNPYYARVQMNGHRRPPQVPGQATAVLHDSVVVNHSSTQVHREFIVYDRYQAYPEFLVEVSV